MKKIKLFRSMVLLAILFVPTLCLAQEKAGPDFKVMADTVWVLITAPWYSL